MTKSPRRSSKSRRNRKHGLYLHDCPACDNKWSAPFKVKHCFKCGLDERQGESGVIRRRFVETVKCADGEIRMKLYLAKDRRKEDTDAQEALQ